MLSETAQKIFKMKYASSENEDWGDACLRIVDHVVSAEDLYFTSDEEKETLMAEFFKMIYEKYFLPGGRIIANAGTGIKNLNNCYLLPIEDSRQSIYQTLKDAAEIFAHGGGVGYNFSNIREEGAPILSTGGRASGPLSFMSLFDQTGEVIQQASRRGAQMAILDVDHMDIEKFIDFKATLNSRNERILEEYHRNLSRMGKKLKDTVYFDVLKHTLLDDQLTHFNISVNLTDKFMDSVARDGDFDLVSRVNPESRRTIKARELFRRLATQAWKSGDPGVFFEDRTNEDNLVPYIGRIKGTNPCVTGDTKILTVYEGAKTFKELAERGEDILVYAFDTKNKIPVIRWMRNPRKTRENAWLLEIEFDSGLVLRCTEDHHLYNMRGEKVPANELKIGQSIRAFRVSMHRNDHYRAHGWVDGKSRHQYVARMVWEAYNGKIPQGMILHHKDFDKLNNKIENLELVTNSQHARIHRLHRVDGGYYRHGNHKIVDIRDGGYGDVYNGTVDDVHTYIIADPYNDGDELSGIVSANCGEVGLLPYEPCCLGSINLAKFYNENNEGIGYIDFETLEKVVRLSVRFLDDVQEVSSTPLEKVNYYSKNLRRIGLGVMGWADLLALLEIPYDSPTAFELAKYLSWFISFFAWLESIELAKARGPFMLFDKDKINRNILYKIFKNDYTRGYFNVEDMRVRNVSVTSIAPTGTIALLADVNSSIEPFFALAYTRYITEGVGNIAKDSIIETNKILERKLIKYGLDDQEIEQVKEYYSKHSTLQGCDLVPDKLKAVFKTAHEIHWKDHIAMQAAWQEYVTNSVSKTINMPENATIEDVENAFFIMWKSRLKGGTIYRNNSKSFQILNIGN